VTSKMHCKGAAALQGQASQTAEQIFPCKRHATCGTDRLTLAEVTIESRRLTTYCSR
jgi:hypothetical protein